MRLFVDNDHEGICIEVSSLSVHHALTFCTVKNSVNLQNELLKLVKKGFVNSFETRNSEIKIAFFTKFVQEII